MPFKTFSGIATGSSHKRNGTPCEDSFRISHTPDKKWVGAVISDGCGSASRAKDGSAFISDFIIDGLINFSPHLDRRGPGDWLIDHSVVLLANLREAMRQKFDAPLTNYSATIIGAMISDTGGFILHLGDGIASAFSIDDGDPQNRTLQINSQSDPENGEYANQTFYVTESNWIRHVRITSLGDAECLVICSDGAQDLFYEGSEAYGPALIPLLNGLSTALDGPNEFLEQKISSPDAANMSSDDKTIVVLAKPEFLAGLPSIKETIISRGPSKTDTGIKDFPSAREPTPPLDLNRTDSLKSSEYESGKRGFGLPTFKQVSRVGFYATIYFSISIVVVIIFGIWLWNHNKHDKDTIEQHPISMPRGKVGGQPNVSPTPMELNTKALPSKGGAQWRQETPKVEKDKEKTGMTPIPTPIEMPLAPD